MRSGLACGPSRPGGGALATVLQIGPQKPNGSSWPTLMRTDRRAYRYTINITFLNIYVDAYHPGAQVRRMVKNGGVYLNNAKVTDDKRAVTSSDLIDGRLALVACGKKNKMLVRVE